MCLKVKYIVIIIGVDEWADSKSGPSDRSF
jgi:hypothetical protein